MVAGFVTELCTDYCFGWSSYATADRASLNRQRFVIVAAGVLISGVAFAAGGQPSLAIVLPLAASGVVLLVFELARTAHRRFGDPTRDEPSKDPGTDHVS